MTTILGIDTATSGCSAAIWRDGDCLAMQSARMPRGQSEALAPMLERVRDDAGMGFDALDAVAVTRGPGAFTGLRIGISAARALALTIGVPCLGIGTFDALKADALPLAQSQEASALVVAIESKREDLYLAAYRADGTEIMAPSAALPETLSTEMAAYTSVAVAGDAAQIVADQLAVGTAAHLLDTVEVPNAVTVARLAALYLNEGTECPPTPLYMRPPDVTLPPKT